MLNKKNLLTLALAVTPMIASADIEVYSQDFENGLNANEEVVYADGSTRVVGGNPIAVTGRNWDLHAVGGNPWVEQGLTGNVMGHVYANYDYYEDNYYQINDIAVSNQLNNIKLSFDFDSWIRDDVDGFAVSVCTSNCTANAQNINHGFSLLEPAGGDMRYQNLNVGEYYDDSLKRLAEGQTGGNVRGFDGHENGSSMAGTAMFDLSAYAGQTIALRFSFASDSGGQAEGINIDNILIEGDCANGNPNGNGGCGGGNNQVPEPASLSLAMIGLAGMYRRRKTGRWL